MPGAGNGMGDGGFLADLGMRSRMGGRGIGGIREMMKGMMGGGGGMGGMSEMKAKMGGMMGGKDAGGDNGENPFHKLPAVPHISLRKMLENLDAIDSLGQHNPESAAYVAALRHQILDKVSCTTGCMHHKSTNEHGLCYEQSCAFHYQPGLSENKRPILCVEELSIMALHKEAEVQVHFAVKPYAVEPDDDMLPTALYTEMNDKYKYRIRLKDGTQQETTTRVCHNVTCAEHPPPVPINAGDTLYITIVALDQKKQFIHLHPGSFRVVAIGSQSGKSCPGGGLLPHGLRGRK